MQGTEPATIFATLEFNICRMPVHRTSSGKDQKGNYAGAQDCASELDHRASGDAIGFRAFDEATSFKALGKTIASGLQAKPIASTISAKVRSHWLQSFKSFGRFSNQFNLGGFPLKTQTGKLLPLDMGSEQNQDRIPLDKIPEQHVC